MNQPTDPAEYAIEPNHYTREAFAPLLDHSALAAETADEFYLGHIARGMVQLGRVALIHEDIAAYREWTVVTEGFVGDLQSRKMSFVRAQYYQDVAEAHFYGALHGDTEAATKLNSLLHANTMGYALTDVLSACAQEGVSPHTWITEFIPGADKRALAWHNYAYSRRQAAADKGEFVSREELLASGAWHSVDDFLSGELSAKMTFIVASTVFEFARTVEEKNHVIDRFSLKLEDEISPTQYRKLLEFASRVNADPDILPEKKRDLTNEVDAAIPNEAVDGKTVDFLTYGTFKLSQEIANGGFPADIMQAANDLARNDDHPYRQAQIYDGLLKNAADMYVGRKEFERAAAMLTGISDTGLWVEAIQKYRRHGGDINLALSGDEMRMILGDGDAPTIPNRPVQWEARRDVANYLRHMENQDYAQAESIVISMSQKIGSKSPDALAGFTFPAFLQRLLARNPASAHIGMQVVNNIDRSTFGYHRQVYEMLVARGNQEVQAAQRADLQQGAHHRAMYFGHYASLMLAAVQISL